MRLRELQLPSTQSHILRSTLITAYNFFHGNLNLHFTLYQRVVRSNCKGPMWIAIYCASARATSSVHVEPHLSVNVDHGLQVISRLLELASLKSFSMRQL